MTIDVYIAEALRARGIKPAAPLVNLHETSDIWSDQRTLVVKVGYENSRYNYLSDLGVLSKAGVRCERPLVDDVIEIGDRHAIVVGFLAPDRPTRASDAEAVGLLLRDIHEATLASDLYCPRGKDHVMFPDDWLAQNIIIHNGLPYLVDLDLWKDWNRETAISLACDEFLQQLPHDADDIAAFYRGYGAY